MYMYIGVQIHIILWGVQSLPLMNVIAHCAIDLLTALAPPPGHRKIS